MDGKIKITNENVSDYISEKSRKYISDNIEIKKLQPIRLFIFALFFSLSLLSISGMGYFLVSLPKITGKQTSYLPLNDVFAFIMEKSIYIFALISFIFFIWLMYVLTMNFYSNKLKRLLAVTRVLFVFVIVITVPVFLVSILFIPPIFGNLARYVFIYLGIFLYIILSIHWCKKRIKVFYKKQERSSIEKILDKVMIWVWPVMLLLSGLSYASAPFRRESREALYGIVSPFFILVVIPIAYVTFYYLFGHVLELYYMNKYPEAIRMETDFTKEEWYGPKYQKSKEVMRKIKEFEDYINN